MQTTRYLVRTFIEFTTGMQHGQYYLEGRLSFFFHEPGRDTTTIVHNADRVVRMNRNVDSCTETTHRLIDRVVDHFIGQMVQTFHPDVANVHGGTQTNCLKAFKHLNIVGSIISALDKV